MADGLGDLHPQVLRDDEAAGEHTIRTIRRRPSFASRAIYLPKVMVPDGDSLRELDYDTDVLSRIDWRGFDPRDIADGIPENVRSADAQLQRIGLTEEGDESFFRETVAGHGEVAAFDPGYAVRMILDIVPNPFVGREVVGRLRDALRSRGFDDWRLGGIAHIVAEELRAKMDRERDVRAEALFKKAVSDGHIQFRLRLDGRDWRMPFGFDATEPRGRQLLSSRGGPLQKSLFAPAFERDFNGDEKDVAVYLDGEAAVTWWHRNVARTQYGIQGWKKRRIYPVFIFAVRGDGKPGRILVLETKGDHLDNLDTDYKREVLSILSSSFAWDTGARAGELELLVADGQTVECALILTSEWQLRLPQFLDGPTR